MVSRKRLIRALKTLERKKASKQQRHNKRKKRASRRLRDSNTNQKERILLY